MEKEGYVSLWVGSIETDEMLNEYVSPLYTKEGGWGKSSFLKDFNIDFNAGFIEKIYRKETVNSIRKLIAGCSYEDVVIPQYEKIMKGVSKKKYNVGILFYNFQYKGNLEKVKGENYNFEFIGSVSYSKSDQLDEDICKPFRIWLI